MDFCDDWKVSHEEFLSWNEYTRQKHLAYYLDNRERCPGCGTKHSDWVDSEGQIIRQPDYVVDTRVCFGCRKVENVQEQKQADAKRPGQGMITRGLKFFLRRRIEGDDKRR